MDGLTFAAEIVKALAWPAAIIALVLILHGPIGDLIGLIKRFKYKDWEVIFERQVAEVRAEARAELDVAPIDDQGAAVLMKLAELSPRAMVLEAWHQIEDALMAVAKRHNISLPDRAGRLQVVQALARAQLIDPGKMAIISELRALRNNAAHAPDFALTKDSAMDFARLAQQVTEYLKKL